MVSSRRTDRTGTMTYWVVKAYLMFICNEPGVLILDLLAARFRPSKPAIHTLRRFLVYLCCLGVLYNLIHMPSRSHLRILGSGFEPEDASPLGIGVGAGL
jgi:hypothetical protein